MSEKTIREIVDSAHGLCKGINLFAGYMPKNTVDKKKEILFWRNVVNIYGLYCDCDKCMIKEKDNLIQFFYEHSLITRNQYQEVRKFYYDISALRAWFCHNNDKELYFSKERSDTIQRFIDRAFLISTQKPKGLDNITDSGWDILNLNIMNRFDIYLEVIKEALKNIQMSEDKESLIDKLCEIYAKALFNDSELISNVLASIYCYLRVDCGMPIKNIANGVERLRKQLSSNEYSICDILSIIKTTNKIFLNKADIVKASMERISFEL